MIELKASYKAENSKAELACLEAAPLSQKMKNRTKAVSEVKKNDRKNYKDKNGKKKNFSPKKDSNEKNPK